MNVVLVTVWVVSAGLACARASPPQSLYLLRAEPVEARDSTQSAPTIGLGSLQVAAYLRQPGLMLETGPNQVRPAQHHRWAEPLEDGVRRLLRAELSRALGSDVSADAVDRRRWETVVDVLIDQLHGRLNGRALLSASWRITRRDAEPATHRFAGSAPLPREGYGGLVEAEIALIGQLAQAIARSLRTQSKAQ